MFSGLFGSNGKLSKGGSKRAAKKARKNLKHRLHMEPLEERRLMTATLSATSPTVQETGPGTFSIGFTVSLSGMNVGDPAITFAYGTNALGIPVGMAATSGLDYQSQTQQLTWSTNQSMPITIMGTNDTIVEGTEQFKLDLSLVGQYVDPPNINDGIATILPSDGGVDLSISDVTVTEGNSGTLNASFTVTRSDATGNPTFSYETVASTATSPADFTATSGNNTSFAVGSLTKIVTVPIKGETVVEATEQFFLNLTGATNASIVDAQGIGTILDNDNALAAALTNLPDSPVAGDMLLTGGMQTAVPIGDGLSLVYNSLTTPHPIGTVETTLATGGLIPDSFVVKLYRVGQTPHIAEKTYSTSGMGLTANGPVRFALQFDAAGFSTGRHELRAEVVANFSDPTIPLPSRTRNYTFFENIVNRGGTASSFGEGWWLSGLDQLETSQAATAGVLLVKADGRSFWFAKSGSTYTRPAGEPDFSTLTVSGLIYTLKDKYGNKSVFNSSGELTSTFDRNNNEVKIVRTDGLVTKVTDWFNRDTVLSYDGNNRLATVANHAGFVTTIARDANGKPISITPPRADSGGSSTVGVFTHSTAQFQLTNSHGGDPDLSYLFGPAGHTLQPVAGDWNGTGGDGMDTVGVYDSTAGSVYFLNDQHEAGGAEYAFDYGAPGTAYLAIAGDWDGNGIDSIGLYDPNVGSFLLKNANNAGAADYTFLFGPGGNTRLPVVGDWDGDGKDTIGVFDPVAGGFYLKNDLAGGAADAMFTFNPAGTGAKPIAGDWDDDGASSIGVYQPTGGTFYLRNDNSVGSAHWTFAYGAGGSGVTPIAGDWDGAVTYLGYVEAGNGIGQLGSITDGSGRTNSVLYDAKRRVDKLTSPHPSTFGATVSTELESIQSAAAASDDPNGTLPRKGLSEDEKDFQTEFQTDRFGHVAWTKDSLAAQIRFVRNSEGLATQMVLPHATTGIDTGPDYDYVYDSRLNLERIVNPDGSDEEWSYHPTLNLVMSHKDELNRQTTWSRDGEGNVTAVTDNASKATNFVVDARGFVTSVTTADPDGLGPQGSATTIYMRDGYERVTTLKRPLLQGQVLGSEHTVVWTYDLADNVLSETDELGRRTDLTWNPLNQLVSTQGPDPDGIGIGQPAPVWKNFYSAAGLMVGEIDPLGVLTRTIYGGTGLVTKRVFPDPATGRPTGSINSPVETFSYDAAGQIATSVDALGRVTQYQFDAAGLLDLVTSPDPDGGGPLPAMLTDYVRDKRGRVTKTIGTDPDGAGGLPAPETVYGYNDRDWTTSMTLPDPDGSAGPLGSPVWLYQHNVAGQVTLKTDPNLGKTEYVIDALARVERIKTPNPSSGLPTGPEWVFVFDALSRVKEEIDPLGHSTKHEFDAWNRETKTIDAKLNEYLSVYDAASQIDTVTAPLGRITDYDWDGLGRIKTVKPPDPSTGAASTAHATTYEHDLVGNVTKIIGADPDGAGFGVPAPFVTNVYDKLYRQVQTTDERGKNTFFTFDVASNTKTLKDPDNNITEWFYDGLNREIEERNQLGQSRLTIYDAGGFVKTYTDRNERVTEFSHDNLGRYTEERWKNGATTIRTISSGYDPNSNLASISDTDSAYALQYDKLNRVTFESNAGTPNMAVVELTRQYDADSRQTALLTKVGSTLDFQNLYQFDELDRMTKVEQSGQSGGNTVSAKRVDLAWDAASRLDLVTRYKDLAGTQLVATSDYVWDKLDRPTALTHAKNAAIIADYDWTYDKLSRKTSFISSIDATVNYAYDAASQLTTSDVAGTTVGDENFGYDDAGNRNTNGFTVGTNNRMLSDGVYNYEYDDEGNRTKRTKIIGGQYDVYTWDHRNRLTLVTTKTSGHVTLKNVAFVYDTFDRRLAVQVDTNGDGSFEQTKRYAYDGQHVAFVFSGSTPASLTNRYLHGPAIDQVFADEQLGNEVLWSLTDDQGTVRDLIDGNATVENHIKYGSFGNITSESNAAVDHIFGYTGRELDEATGLSYYRARYYDAPAGEFLSEDPSGFGAGDFNLGRYVGNSPTNATDPTGHKGAWGNYWHYLTNPSHMDDDLETGFYVAGGTAAVAGAAAGGLVVAGYGAVTVTAAATAAAPVVAAEVVDTAAEELATAVTGVPVIFPTSPADLLQDGGKVLGKNLAKGAIEEATPGAARTLLPELLDDVPMSAPTEHAEEMIRLYRGDAAGMTEFTAKAVKRDGYLEAQRIIDEGDMDDLMKKHRIDSRGSPLITLTSDERMAQLFARRHGQVYEMLMPRSRVRPNPFNTAESEWLTPLRVKPSDIVRELR